jgi:pyruvate formate-lyase/glycerol dehydratase family glycyl radical enzyme
MRAIKNEGRESMGKLTNSMTARGMKRREACIDAVPEICVERARFITEAYRKYESERVVIKRAKALEYILERMSIYIQPQELLVGNHSSRLRAAPIFPEYDVEFIEQEIREFPTRQGDPFVVRAEVERELLDVCRYWKGRTVRERVLTMLPEDTRKAGEDGVAGFDSAWTLFNGDGHIAPDYPRVLREGLSGIVADIDRRLVEYDIGDPENLPKYYFLNAAKTACVAAIRFARRFAQLAREMVEKEPEASRKSELLEIARICEKVPGEPATTFWEALQSLWIVHLVVQIETNGHSVSLGRFDQYMLPYYAADIASGVRTSEQLFELVQCFWIKLSELTKIRPTGDANLFPGYPMFQNLTIGGQTRERRDAANDLTFLCLSAQATVRLVQPNLTARVHRNAGEDYLHACAELIKLGMGFPSLFNDEVIVLSMVNRGVDLSDALDYCLVGCVEPSTQGKFGGRYGAGLTNLTKIFDVAVHGGKDPRTGLRLRPETKDLSTFASFDEVKAAYKNQVQFFVRHRIIRDNIQDMVWEELAPTPFLDSMVLDCIGRGKGQKEGGAIYDFTGGETGNIANVANSMAVIRKLVFEEKRLTGEQLLKAVDSDFSGKEGERVRQLVINTVPKYGNDDDYVDEIAREAFAIYLHEEPKYMNTRLHRGPIGCCFHPSTASISANVPFGLNVGATPDGRKAWSPVADVLSPYRGTDETGPTAAVRSVAKLDNYLLSGGAIYNIKFSPALLQTDDALKRMTDLVRVYFDLGGMEIQFNVIARETLLEAQQKPQEHKDLIVRVAGYSAYFVVQDRRVQDDIIARTEHKAI